MGGKPKPGTSPDKRLKSNKPAAKKAAPAKKANPFAAKKGVNPFAKKK